MRILFSPVGDTDPVRNYHDGGLLHILRHCGPFDQIILFLTESMEQKETDFQCYTRGIRRVEKEKQYDTPSDIVFIRTGITNPHEYTSLLRLQKEFRTVYKANPQADWYLNISSGTPQMKSVITLLGIEYSKTNPIQVSTPNDASNRKTPPCTSGDLIDMLDCNSDSEEGARNRCHVADLGLLKKYGLQLQIESLVDAYEYGAALKLLGTDRELFTDTARKLLEHGKLRQKLQWKEANKVIANYENSPLIDRPDDFTEYFLLAEMRQKRGELADFIVKLSPLLMDLGKKYLDIIEARNCFRLRDITEERNGTIWFQAKKAKENTPGLYNHFVDTFAKGAELYNNPLAFEHIVSICEYLSQNTLSDDKKHKEIQSTFTRLRIVEKNVRNQVAHTIANITEEKIEDWTSGKQRDSGKKHGKEKRFGHLDRTEPMKSTEILKLLRLAIKLIRKQDVSLRGTYDHLNTCIKEELEK